MSSEESTPLARALANVDSAQQMVRDQTAPAGFLAGLELRWLRRLADAVRAELDPQQPETFTLDEAAAAGRNFAENYPVEDDHSAAVAITEAITSGLITGPAGYEMAVDLLANLDGELDGYRILVSREGESRYLAGEVLNIEPEDETDTMDVLRTAVTIANGLLATAKETE
jgi:hypothetical protein